MGYLLAKPAKYFRQKVSSRRVRKAKLRTEQQRQLRERQAQFRKGFIPKGRTPKYLKSPDSIKPQLPTRGTKRRKRFGIF